MKHFLGHAPFWQLLLAGWSASVVASLVIACHRRDVTWEGAVEALLMSAFFGMFFACMVGMTRESM